MEWLRVLTGAAQKMMRSRVVRLFTGWMTSAIGTWSLMSHSVNRGCIKEIS